MLNSPSVPLPGTEPSTRPTEKDTHRSHTATPTTSQGVRRPKKNQAPSLLRSRRKQSTQERKYASKQAKQIQQKTPCLLLLLLSQAPRRATFPTAHAVREKQAPSSVVQNRPQRRARDSLARERGGGCSAGNQPALHRKGKKSKSPNSVGANKIMGKEKSHARLKRSKAEMGKCRASGGG